MLAQRGTLHALYWRLHSKFLRNERREAERFLAMLDDEAGLNPEAIAAEIGEPHARRLKRIRERMAIGEYGWLHASGASCPDLGPCPWVEPSGAEKDFHKVLLRQPGLGGMLRELGARDWATPAHEVDMGEFGICDLLIREGRIVHVVEVKMGQAPTSVVGQISRYALAAELDMNLGLHDEVRAGVIAEGFPKYVAMELSRLGVAMILHRGTAHGMSRLETGGDER